MNSNGSPFGTAARAAHTATSLAISAGANVDALHRMFGRASAEVTLNVYSDLFDDDLHDVVMRLDHAALR